MNIKNIDLYIIYKMNYFKKSLSFRILSNCHLNKKYSSVKRKEYDTFGEIEVQNDKYWGAQTQRSLQNFEIGTEEDKMPLSVIKAFAVIKKSLAKVNISYGLKKEIGEAIIKSSDEVLENKFNSHFPLVIFQTGSGTQSNMNVNEVLANRSSEILGGSIGKDSLVNPNDHVNKSQSSNDTFPTAMHVSVAIEINKNLFPSITNLKHELQIKQNKFKDIIKIGRTHTQDATPLTLGQEFSGYLQQVQNHICHLEHSIEYIYQLAQGGTAVGTGLNTFEGFDKDVAKQIAEETGLPFVTAPNKFESLAAHDALCNLSGVLNSLASALYKISSDIKLLSGELKELIVPNKEMIDETMMSCIQVMGNHTCVTVGNMSGHFELNVFNPVIASNVLSSVNLLSKASLNLSQVVSYLDANHQVIKELMSRSLMLVTALNPYIGYAKAAQIAKYAHKNHLTLKEASLKLNILTEKQFDEYVKPENMISPSKKK